jgi:hypothetical protein
MVHFCGHHDTRTTNFESVLIEWTDTNRRNTTFEGTAEIRG